MDRRSVWAGIGHGYQVQLRYLKVRHTDFIFAAMAEEFGSSHSDHRILAGVL
jgi:cell division protein FtsW (lipid II flippase)